MKLRQLYQSQSVLIRGSFFAFLGGMAANFLTYLFQLATGRLLTPSDYGILISLRSLMVYAGLLSGAIQTALTKKTSEFSGQKKLNEIAKLFWVMLKYLSILALLVTILLLLSSSSLSNFLQIENLKLLFFLSLIAGINYLLIIPSGLLSGLLRFKALAAVITINAGLLLILSVAAIYLGQGLPGVLSAHLLAGLGAFGLGVFLLRQNICRPALPQAANHFIGEIAKFTGPTIFITVSLMAFYNTDILLVKHFFPAEQVGIYSSASIVGRIIFFATAIITGVMFPLVSGKQASGEKYKIVFWTALSLVLFGTICLSGIYLLFPTQIIRILFGQAYTAAAPLLPYFAVFMGLYSVLNLISSFFLAVKEFLIAPVLAIGALAQAGAIWLWHENLTQVINISVGVVGVLIILSFGIYFYHEKT